jgi:phage N-6-adenine-methyltransferase
MNTKVMFSSNNDMWSTPQHLFDVLNAEFNFDLDVCATEFDTKCSHFYSPEVDGLKQEWHGTCFMNPPYSSVKTWIKKASYEFKEHKSTVVCLVPARTDTKWMQDYCCDADEIRLIKGRLHFNDGPNSAPFPSCIVVFKPHTRDEPYIHFWEVPKSIEELGDING